MSTWTELGKPIDLEVKPGKVNFVVGELTPAVHPGTGKDVDNFVEMALPSCGNWDQKEIRRHQIRAVLLKVCP